MARQLNKNRIGISRAIAFTAFGLFLVSKAYIAEGTDIHEILEFLGYALILLCAFGRVYCIAYIGGRKNAELVNSGPFSIVRNPLYLFSLIGVLGIGMLSTRLSLVVTLPALFMWVYHYLVAREEEFLLGKFGAAYEAYRAATPRFIPDFHLWKDAESVELKPRFLLNGMLDAAMWFLAFPIFEYADYLHETGWLPKLFTMP